MKQNNIVLLYKAMIRLSFVVVAAPCPRGNVVELEKSSEMTDGDN